MHLGELAELDTLRGIAARLGAAGHGQRGAIASEGARLLGVSVQTLYNRLRAVGFASGRKLRADRGDTRLSDEAVMAVAAQLQASRRATGKGLLPVIDAIDMALSNGLLDARVSATTMLRVMRRKGCHPAQLAQPAPHVQMRSLHPNHVWQLDASLCVLYYLHNGRARVMDERKFNARKPRDLARIDNRRVLRYALTDHFSGTVTARYYNVSGEDQRTLFEFLMFAMQRMEGRVMHGVPFMLVWDAGSANQSHAIGNLLTNLGVRHWAHIPGNPRAKGQVEGIHNVIERKFEGRLTFKSIDSIEFLNAKLDLWTAAFNAGAQHRRTGHTRNAVWQTIRADQLRLCPPVATCALLMHSKPEPRTVAGNLTVSYKPRGHERADYSVANVPGVRVGDRVMVTVNPYRAPAVFVIVKDEHGTERHVECDPIATTAGGFFAHSPVVGERYAAAADTDVDTARRDANELAWGERDTLKALAAKTRGAVAFDGQIDPFKDLEEAVRNAPSFMVRPGTQLHLPNEAQVELRPMGLVEVLQELRSRLGRALGQHEREAVQAWFPDGVAPEEMDALVERVQQLSAAGAPPAFIEPPRLVAVK
ncbi:MAG: transposase family protein [Dokdonella sp.]|uniref:hypothetical protein n=1 Tax=Dokdonella sp. TaxID=2291710 RepID=UPI0013119021|nr:hypothetical protein [Dokdonella sp.]KAB2899865.1 MAG: transposase family protein [Dokdonella sp.]MBX3702089.1 DDE-type integrase/transposase/recombinase [Dokdonella sp.]